MADSDVVSLDAWCSDTRYIYCPRCGQGQYEISHLKVGCDFGPWYCDDTRCGYAFVGVVTARGADVQMLPDRIVRTTVTLRAERPFTLIVRGMRFEGRDKDHDEGHGAYFYEEHTCPTNILSDIVRFIDETGNEDPHGIFTYVKTEEGDPRED